MLRVPADPRGQRAVLVVLVHRGEVAPGRVAARQLHHARLEVDAEPLPQQQQDRRPRWRPPRSPPRQQPRRSQKEREKPRLQQHPIGLVAGEILRRADKRKEAREADHQHRARPHIRDQKHRRNQPHPAHRHQHVVAARKPQQRRRVPETQRPHAARIVQILARRQNPLRADQSLDLKQQRKERRKVDQPQRAQKQPARDQAVRRAVFRIEEIKKSPPHRLHDRSFAHELLCDLTLKIVRRSLNQE